MIKDIYLQDIEKTLTDKRDFLTIEARELSQTIISNLRLDNEISLGANKKVLGEICRALEVSSNYSEIGQHYYYHFYKDSHLESCVLVNTPIELFEMIANNCRPR